MFPITNLTISSFELESFLFPAQGESFRLLVGHVISMTIRSVYILTNGIIRTRLKVNPKYWSRICCYFSKLGCKECEFKEITYRPQPTINKSNAHPNQSGKVTPLNSKNNATSINVDGNFLVRLSKFNFDVRVRCPDFIYQETSNIYRIRRSKQKHVLTNSKFTEIKKKMMDDGPHLTVISVKRMIKWSLYHGYTSSPNIDPWS